MSLRSRVLRLTPLLGGLGAMVLVVLAGMLAVELLEPDSPARGPAAPAASAGADRSPARPVPQPTQPGATMTVVDPSWVTLNAARAGIPEAAMRAYATAQLRAPRDCKLGWTTLAGIGWVESHHGTIGGRTLGADGVPSTPIIGPALDGAGGFAAIRATRTSEQATGDPRWDHAVGPLQFLMSTWRRWHTDGDGDGVADPEDIDDAAATAAAYLCASGYDLTTGGGWAQGIWSYNRSTTYLRDVYAAADAYARRTE